LSTHRGEKTVQTKLSRIAEIAKAKPNEKLTSLAHLINPELLEICHKEADGRKATGIDQVTKEEYGKNLEENLENLVARMKQHAYRPQPVRRVYIPKPGTTKQRPLGIPSYEDKLVQAGLSKVLNAIYEEDFLHCSYGFRPGRGQHDALKSLNQILDSGNVNYIVDADIAGFFDHVDHEWLMKFLEHRIADPNILRLIGRFLKAGVIEEGKLYKTHEGTPQGGVVSPILANIYLHYVIDLWFEKIIKKQCRGKAYMVRFADDIVFCFKYEDEAQSFYKALVERLAKFNLEVATDKTKIIPFGKNAEQECQRQGKQKPDTFDFLGFTHYGGKSKKGKFRVKRKTSQKKYRASLLRCKEWVRKNRNMPMRELWRRFCRKLQGHYQYYGVTDNSRTLARFKDETKRIMFKWLNRRSQRKSFDWDKFNLFLKRYPLPKAKIYVNIFEFRPGLEITL